MGNGHKRGLREAHAVRHAVRGYAALKEQPEAPSKDAGRCRKRLRSSLSSSGREAEHDAAVGAPDRLGALVLAVGRSSARR